LVSGIIGIKTPREMIQVILDTKMQYSIDLGMVLFEIVSLCKRAKEVKSL
jgi:hypothetical protein